MTGTLMCVGLNLTKESTMTKKERIAALEAKVVQLEMDVRNLQCMITHPVLVPYEPPAYDDSYPNFWAPKVTC